MTAKVWGAVTEQEKTAIRERKAAEAAKMTFPYQPKAVFTKSGGTVVEIQGVEHQIDRPQMGRSRDYWYYLATIKWGDTGKTSEPGRHLYAFDLCADEGNGFEEIRQLSEAMMDYLGKHGEWRKAKPEGWYAHKRK